MEYALLQNHWNFVCLFMLNESVNDQGDKLKNHKLWSVYSPSGAEFSFAANVIQPLSSTLNNVSEKSSGKFSSANSLQTKFAPVCKYRKVSNFRDSIRQWCVFCCKMGLWHSEQEFNEFGHFRQISAEPFQLIASLQDNAVEIIAMHM